MSKAEYLKAKFVEWLLEGNLSFDISRDAIGTEVLFSEKRRSADIVILSDKLHALEIKGDFDDFRKLRKQLTDYHRTFDKVSVITTPKRIERIYRYLQPYTGLILFDNGTFRVKRLAKQRGRLDKYSLLMFLHRKELNALLKTRKNNLSTDEVRKYIVNRLSQKKIREVAYASLKSRYRYLFRLFLNDTGGNIVWDELKGLSGRISELYI
jgi:hypothetical protein